MSREYVYVGTYTENSDSKGIYIYVWDRVSERLALSGVQSRCINPSFLAAHPAGRFLYAANELGDSAKISAYEIDPLTGLLRYINGKIQGPGCGTCHIAVTPNGRAVCAADYNSGHLFSCEVCKDGSLGEVVTVVQHTGNGPHPRQEQSHAHQVIFDPMGQRLIGVDLGIDRLMVYDIDDAGRFKPASHPYSVVSPGEGPRHMLFHPNGEWVYVLSELGNNVITYSYDCNSGEFTHCQTVSAMPPDYMGTGFAAELQLSRDTRYLYASVRGYDHIVCFLVNQENGALSRTAAYPCFGEEPRMFSFDAEGKHMFIANQKSHSVVVIPVDTETGELKKPCCEASVPQPCFVQSLVIW